MQAQQTLIAEKLNHLTAILDDASEGFLTAAQYARNRELEIQFEKFSYERKDFAREIKKLVQEMGASSYSKGGFLSLLHRTWKDMCFKLKSRDRDVVRCCCVIGEKFVSNYYESILNDPLLPGHIRNILKQQWNSIQASLQHFQVTEHAGINANGVSPGGKTAVTGSAEKKVLYLISYLQQVSKDFEMIADEIEDKNLRNAFLALSTEDKQFAEELHRQVRLCGFPNAARELHVQWEFEEDENLAANSPVYKNNELLHLCDKSEYLFLKLYTDALKELLSFSSLKDMMIYQYNSIRAGFLKLRLLNSLRFSNEFSHI